DPEQKIEYKAETMSEFGDMDVVVLINKGSASASEIFAGAIKGNNRGLIIGVPTFGKGSVQTVIPLKDKSALRLTTAAYFTPSGETIRDKGIEPDIYVKREKRVVEKKKSSAQIDAEKKKNAVFEKVSDEDNRKNGKSGKKDKLSREKDSREAEKKSVDDDVKAEEGGRYDNQLQTALNVLQGAKKFEQFKTRRSADSISDRPVETSPVGRDNSPGGRTDGDDQD
ncbi:MAG: S41 family peptidase, partial [Candidatus Omnitrophota bacterium]